MTRKFAITAASLFVIAASSISAHAEPMIAEFDIAGSNGTYPAGINADGWIAGYYFESQLFGFLRAPDGTITTIDPANSTSTTITGINGDETVVGFYLSSSGGTHGFLRSADGTITEFDPSGSVDTQPAAINANGVIAGSWYDSNYQGHGFVRAADGTITTFDPPESVQDNVFGINDSGMVVGTTYDGTKFSAYLRDTDGTITIVSLDSTDTEGAGVNDRGVIAGYARYPTHSKTLGFLRSANGKIVKYDGAARARNTFVRAINAKNETAGYWGLHGESATHGFVRTPNGKRRTFDAPDAGTARLQGTFAMSINDSGAVTGWYVDSESRTHGFLRTP